MTESFRLTPHSLPLDDVKAQSIAGLEQGSTYRVCSTSNVKRVAGTISHTARGLTVPGATCCTIAAAGDLAINQAVKSIAIASQYLAQDGLQCACQPSFDPHGALLFRVVCHGTNELKEEVGELTAEEHKVMKVAGASDPYKVAGAVAQSMRKWDEHESSSPFAARLAAQGPVAVGNAVRALSYARGYTTQDDTDLMFVPTFAHVKSEATIPGRPTGERSLVMMNIFKTAVQEEGASVINM